MKLLLILLLSISAYSQAPTLKVKFCEHTGNIDRFENVRVLPAVGLKIIYFDGQKISYVLQDNVGTKVGDLTISPATELPPNFEKEYKKGQFWIIFCATHSYVYQIQKFKEK
jgi:hypothetical protein